MFFWSIEKLKKSLSEKRPSQSDVFRYTLGLSIITILIGNFPVEFYTNTNYVWIEWGAFTLSNFLGIIGCYIANGRDKGVDFLERTTSIYFVLNIRYFVFVFLASMFTGFVSGGVNYEKNLLTLTILFSFFMTYKAITHFKEVSSSQNNYSE